MAKISTYEKDSTPQLADKVIGTSIAGPPDNTTVNFTFQSILGLFLPEITLQQVTTAGNVTDNDILVNSLSLYDNGNDAYGNISFDDNVFRVQGLGNPNYFFTVDNGQVLSLHNGMAYAKIINNLTTARNYTLPNASGTFALTSDIPVQGIVSLNGLAVANQEMKTGTAGTDFGIVLTGAIHTFNLPDAGIAARGVVTINNQSFKGLKNFTDNIIVNTITIWKGDNNSPTNIAIGNNTLLDNTGNQNTVLGYQAVSATPTGSSFTTAVGHQSLKNVLGNNNTAIGNFSGLILQGGSQNTFIGSEAGGIIGQLGTATNSTAIGYQAFTTKNNQVVIGNGLIDETVIRGTTLVDGGVFNAVDSLIVGGPVKSTQYKLTALNTAPASATAAGTLGDIRITTAFIYVCTATNTWVRAALTGW